MLTLLRGMTSDSLMTVPDVPAESRRPVVDGWLLPEQPSDDLRKPVGSDVPVMMGWVADEGSSSPDYGKVTADAYHAKVKAKYGARSAEFLKLYPAATDYQAGNSEKQAARDRNFAIAGLWAEAWAKQRKSPVYLYYFGNLDKVHRDYTAVDHSVSDDTASAWVRFAETGTPNKGWTAAHGEEGPMFEFGDTRVLRSMLDAERAAFWRSILLP